MVVVVLVMQSDAQLVHCRYHKNFEHKADVESHSSVIRQNQDAAHFEFNVFYYRKISHFDHDHRSA